MKKCLTKIFVPLMALLIITSLGIFPVTVAEQTSQEKAIDFMNQVLPIDLSKYDINLKSDRTRDGTPPLFDDNRKVNDLYYMLYSESSTVSAMFTVENGVLYSANLNPTMGQIITSKQYTSLYDAVADFLKTYQTYTKIDSNNLIAMLNGVDFTKNSTITTENAKLTITNGFWLETNHIVFRWVQVINSAEYPALELTFDKDRNVLLAINDARVLYTIGDTSVNISQKQAVAIAVENLKDYSYEMSDGSIVENFDLSNYGWIAELKTFPVDFVDYELRPYWDVRIFFENDQPGNVFGISALIWANTGEIISFGNMASGGTYTFDDINFSKVNDPWYGNVWVFAGVTIVVVAVAALSIGTIIKKRHK